MKSVTTFQEMLSVNSAPITNPYRLPTWGFGPVELPDHRPDEADDQGPGSDQHHAHQGDQHQGSKYVVVPQGFPLLLLSV